MNKANYVSFLLLIGRLSVTMEAEYPPVSFQNEVEMLMSACKSGSEDAVAKLLREKGVPVCVRDSKGFTPLAYAAICGNEEVVRLLLKVGADPRQEINTEGTSVTADQLATQQNHTRIVRILKKSELKVADK